ncbi:TonB-dependent receptor [Flavobacterium sp. CS20]|uniref:TonB-dependent receptor n=1 Tax=Flavobacterium sp. CS20 TaxID=2775246 RepID=UPI001B3A06CB|nr:TonB-dependent receptor [Flavobacterium sp. CS20]QTY27844.1 TonB-dependent receptor [Flavobacterium sp. CS20]
MFSQRRNDTIKAEKLIIIKQYSPTLNDAFKIKSKPSVSDSISKSQKDVKYSIFSVPVASTFTPVKGTASSIKPQALPYNYQNYARLGAGNFTNILGQFYGSLMLNRYKKLNIEFEHFSSSGGIEDVLLDDDFLDTNLDLNLESAERYFRWDAGIGVDYKRYNWYGIDEQNLNVLPNSIQLFDTDISAIDPLQTYLGLKAYGQLEFEDSFLKNVKLNLQNFSDDYDSSENQITLTSDFQFYITEKTLDLGVKLDYLSGSFDQSFNDPQQGIDYGFFTATVQPSMQFEFGDINLDLGLKATVLNDTELSDTEFFVYPKIKASYKFTDELMFYAGADGDLSQNPYRSIVNQNPFVSPTLSLQPTDNAYTGFAGLNGKTGSLSYNFKVSYKQENDYAFFIENLDVYGFAPFMPTNNYEYSNSFGLAYDDLSTLGINAEVNYAAFDDFNVGLSAHYFNYSVDNLPEATYLPEFKVDVNANYQIGEKWYLHSTLFFVGERKSLQYAILPFDGIGLVSETVDSFVDLNFGVEYQFSERLGFFVSGQNLLDDNYEQWRNFKVQGLQVLGGLSYQFDW